jgi:hypothetical protein
MPHDRTGEEIELDDEPTPEPPRPRCRRCGGSGWLGVDDEERPIPCPECKDHLLGGTAVVHDFSNRLPSQRAQLAIERDNL